MATGLKTVSKPDAPETALPALIDPTSYTVLTPEGQQQFNELIQDNFGGKLLLRHLQRVKGPGSGGESFQIESGGVTKRLHQVEGVVLAFDDAHRGYWKEKYTGGHQPPDCSSDDGITGKGDPGGSCWDCPFSKFGTDVEKLLPDGTPVYGPGQACAQRLRVLVLEPGEWLPLYLDLPPTAIKAFSEYRSTDLTKKGRSLYGVVTRFSLVPGRNSRNVEFPLLSATVTGLLPPDTIKLVRAARLMAEAALREAPVGEEDSPGSLHIPGPESGNGGGEQIGK